MSSQFKHKEVKDDSQSEVLRSLTHREKEIIILHMNGKNRKDVARILKLEVSTVDAHSKSIHIKTGTHDLAGVIRFGHDHHLDLL